MNEAFRYRHWAGFNRYTHPYGLAAICVFGKQSGSPCHCDLFRHGIGTPYTKDTELFGRVPSRPLFPNALDFASRGTCVGSWYGHKLDPMPSFMGSENLNNPLRRTPSISSTSRHYNSPLTYSMEQNGSSAIHILKLMAWAKHLWCWNINQLPIRLLPVRGSLRID